MLYEVITQDLTFYAAAVDEIVETVETTQQRRFATTTGTDEGRHLLFRYDQVDLFQRSYNFV